MKKILFVFAGAIILLLPACQNEKTSEGSTESTGIVDVKAGMEKGQRYGIKTGVIVYKAPMGMTQTLYFDDFGRKETMISEMEMAGTSFKTVDIRKDGFNYNYKTGETTGKKTPWVIQDQNYDKIDPELAKQYKLTDLGTETIAGKECKKFSLEMGSIPTKAWIWKGLLIKSITNMMGKDFIIEAVKVEEGSVPAGIFDLPADVTFN